MAENTDGVALDALVEQITPENRHGEAWPDGVSRPDHQTFSRQTPTGPENDKA